VQKTPQFAPWLSQSQSGALASAASPRVPMPDHQEATV
jgi:hypothetical protein